MQLMYVCNVRLQEAVHNASEHYEAPLLPPTMNFGEPPSPVHYEGAGGQQVRNGHGHYEEPLLPPTMNFGE